MSYFSNNKLYDYYKLTDSFVGSSEITKDVIEIFNNEEIKFDLTELNVLAQKNIINSSQVNTVKISIDWGDGKSEMLSLPLISNKSTIGVYKSNQWKITTHLFNVEKRYQYNTDDVNLLHHIKITAFNACNDKVTIYIPYKMVYKTLYDLGSEITLFSANTTNKNTVSYTLKQKSSDSMMVVNSRDWRSIYGDDEIEVIQQSASDIFVDEFVNIDDMIWNWDSVPVVSLKVNYDITNNFIQGSFINYDVDIEEWEPSVVLKKDSGDEIIKTIKQNGFNFITAQSYTDNEGTEHDVTLKNGIYEVCVNPIIGVNGVVGSSQKQYISYNLTTKPKHLREQEDKKPFVINDNDKSIDFNYRLYGEQEVKNITKAELILSAEYNDDSLKDFLITDCVFHYNLMDSMIDEHGNPKYECSCDNECLGDCKKFTYKVYMRNIPDTYYNPITKNNEKIIYKPSLITDDVLNQGLNSTFFDKEGSIYNLADEEILFDYNIGDFEKYHDSDDFIQLDLSDSINKKINVKWKYNTDDTWDKFIVKVIDKKGVIVVNDTHQYSFDNSFEGLIKNENEFIKNIDGNIIPNGNYNIDVSYEVDMSDYYSKRTKVATHTFNYVYPTPKLTLDAVIPFTKIIYDNNTQKQHLNLCCDIRSNFKDENLKNTILTVNDSTNINLSNLNYIYSFVAPKKDDSFNFKFKASNINDVYNRMGESNSYTVTIGENIDQVISLPSDGVDYIEADSLSWFTIDDNSSKQRSWKWLKENTLHDVNKSFCYKLDEDTYLYGDDTMGSFIIDDGTNVTDKEVLYSVLNVNNGDTYHRRFVPYIGVKDKSWIKYELPSVDYLIISQASVEYDETTDLVNLHFAWGSNNNIPFIGSKETSYIKNMWLIINDGENELRKIKIKGMNQFVVEGFELSENPYNYQIEMNSEYNSTRGNKTTKNDIKALVPLERAIVFVGDPSYYRVSGDQRYVNFRWKLNHLKCDDVYFYYTVNEETTIFNHVKLQNSYQSKVLKKGDIVTYGFKMKSPYLDDYTTQDENGYVTINEMTFSVI